MLVGFVAVVGAWFFAGKVRNGWWMLLIVPVLALIVAFTAGTIRSISGDSDTDAAIAAQASFSSGLFFGGIVSGIELYRTRNKRRQRSSKPQV